MICFDREIETKLSPDHLWTLIKQAFEDPSKSPVWPVELEEVEPFEMDEGQTVRATYKLGSLRVRPSYSITGYDEPLKTFSYASAPTHPLKGGATVLVYPRANGSVLRWHGEYRLRLHPAAPAAALFVQLYFLDHFFERLEENLRRYEADSSSTAQSFRPGESRL